MPAQDIYRFINDVDSVTLERIIERLEFRGRDPTFRGWLEAYLDMLALKPSAQVLVLGCGTGVELRVVAARVGSFGRVIGIDHSPTLLEAARRFAAQDGVHQQVEFHIGDVHRLDYADAGFDAVIAHTLISHVADPLTVLQEAARVVKPHSHVAIFDGDYASWAFGYSDPDFARLMDEAIVASIVNNPRIMRTLPRLMAQAGLRLEEVTPHLFAEIGQGSFFLSAAEAYGPLPVIAGLLPSARVHAWLTEQRRNHDDGTFFAAGSYYTYIARRS
jgi:ubiquinone/menaquinone biosynthesis C-methylase UbiE